MFKQQNLFLQEKEYGHGLNFFSNLLQWNIPHKKIMAEPVQKAIIIPTVFGVWSCLYCIKDVLHNGKLTEITVT